MPCVNANGEITEMAKRILLAMVESSSLDKVAEQTGTPLYRIRMAARELVEAGFAEQQAQSFVTTEAGLAALSKGATTSGSLGNGG
ncbi:MAG: hypothetical protein RB191_25210 [Terriglobia bacterium]|nr:hypothetical protein [Terriglobia bacterium]